MTSFEASLNAALAIVQLTSYLGIHSKSLSARCGGLFFYLSNPAEKPGISSFFGFLSLLRQNAFAWLRTSKVSARTNAKFRNGVSSFTKILAEQILKYDGKKGLVVPDPLKS
jgi:hypothetical protein